MKFLKASRGKKGSRTNSPRLTLSKGGVWSLETKKMLQWDYIKPSPFSDYYIRLFHRPTLDKLFLKGALITIKKSGLSFKGTSKNIIYQTLLFLNECYMRMPAVYCTWTIEHYLGQLI